MQVMAFESIVENGQIKVPDNIRLPNNTKVYVIAPDIKISPEHGFRLAHPEDAAHFKMEVTEEPDSDSSKKQS